MSELEQIELKLGELRIKSQLLAPPQKDRREIFDSLNKFTNWFIEGLNQRNTFNPNHHLDTSTLSVNNHEIQSMQRLFQIYKEQVVTPGAQMASGGSFGLIGN